MTKALARKRALDWGQYGPAMKALPSNRWRAFVTFYLMERPGYGAATTAARRAGFGTARSTADTMHKTASRLMHDDRMLAALAEEARKIIRAGGLEAAQAAMALVRDPEHKDHARGIAMVLARTDPEIQRTDMHVVHRVVDPDMEALEELRAARALGATRERLLELFGGNYLPRLEQLEAEMVERGAKVIDGETVEAA
jgi:phage terminase small subunit